MAIGTKIEGVVQSLVHAMELGRTTFDGYIKASVKTVDGDKVGFVDFSSAGIWPDSNDPRAWFFDQQSAIDTFLAHFNLYAKKREAMAIHWRLKPTLQKTKVKYKKEHPLYPRMKTLLTEVEVFNVRSRFLLSDKAIIPEGDQIMTNALSNPYEITCGGIVVKCTPFGSGSFIANRDIPEDKATLFKKVLFTEYVTEQSRELDGIKVIRRKTAKDDEEKEKEHVKKS